MEFGDLRMLCQEAPGSAAWRAIVATVEAKFALGGAHADEVEAVWLPYAERALERWPHDARFVTSDQLDAAEAGQRCPSLKLARHLRWTGIWGKRDMRALAASADLVALPSLHLYQTEAKDLDALIEVRPALVAELEALRVETCFMEPATITALLERAAQGGALHTLRLSGGHIDVWLGQWALRADRLPVRVLRIHDGGLSGAAGGVRAWIESGAPERLEALELHCTSLGDASTDALLKRASALDELGLRALELPQRDVMAALQRAPLERLSALKLGLFGMDEEQVAPLGELLRGLPALRTLVLNSSHWSTERGASAPPLDALGVLPAWLTDVRTYTMHPARAFAPGSRPRRLNLSDYLTGGATLEPWFDALDLSGLEELRLMNTLIGPERFGAIARRELPALRYADLWCCKLGDEGLACLLDAPWSLGLRTLDLHHNQLTDAALPALGAWLGRAALRQLSLDGHEETLTPQAISQLVEAAAQRSAPLQLSATRRDGHMIVRPIPPRASGAPWPAHILFAEIPR